MNNLFRGLLAGYGAHKLGGGCISTVLIFILLWWLLGTCNDTNGQPLPADLGRPAPHVLTAPLPAKVPATTPQWP